MKSKIYRIRQISTRNFITLGNYRKKSSWLVYPSEAIRQNKNIFENSTDYEVVISEFKEIEVKPIVI